MNLSILGKGGWRSRVGGWCWYFRVLPYMQPPTRNSYFRLDRILSDLFLSLTSTYHRLVCLPLDIPLLLILYRWIKIKCSHSSNIAVYQCKTCPANIQLRILIKFAAQHSGTKKRRENVSVRLQLVSSFPPASLKQHFASIKPTCA